MSLLNRAQQIIGAKEFVHAATFDADVIFKKHITGYSPVPGEPSHGTPHEHNATIVNSNVPSATVQTIDLSAAVPVGAKWIEGYMIGNSTTVGDNIVMCDSTGTVLYDYIIAQVVNQDVPSHFSCPVDVNLRAYWQASNIRWAKFFAVMTRYWY